MEDRKRIGLDLDKWWKLVLGKFNNNAGNVDELSGGETSGTESGWTSYFAPPFQGNNFNDDVDDNYQNVYEYRDDQNDDGGESDDSMASDASSGPCRSNEGSRRVLSSCYKNSTAKSSSEGKMQKQEKQNGGGGGGGGGKNKNPGKDQKKSLLQETSATSYVQSGTKARKTK